VKSCLVQVADAGRLALHLAHDKMERIDQFSARMGQDVRTIYTHRSSVYVGC
jgi:hypothetical protein